MIKISVDEAYAFDMLSILEVKAEKLNSEDSYNQYLSLSEDIISGIGYFKFIIIYKSKDYFNLYSANLALFDKIDKIKDGVVKASEVNNLNYERWKLKSRIQEKFFKENFKEKKIGYK